jgi:hypothetical protein
MNDSQKGHLDCVRPQNIAVRRPKRRGARGSIASSHWLCSLWQLVARTDLPTSYAGPEPKRGWLPGLDVLVRLLASGDEEIFASQTSASRLTSRNPNVVDVCPAGRHR